MLKNSIDLPLNSRESIFYQNGLPIHRQTSFIITEKKINNLVSIKTANNSLLIHLTSLPSTYQQITEFFEDFQYNLDRVETDMMCHK